ncbi:MAG: RodZ domain-containing protein [Cyanobacteria bacterium J06559_3]
MNKVSPAQQEQLLNVGAYLQGIRKEQGKTIDEVANQIFIRPALVRAIEVADLDALPEPVFVQGFIRRYADYLGLDGMEISKQFKPTPVSVLPDPKLANGGSTNGIIAPQDTHGLKVLSEAPPQRNGSASSSVGSGTWKWLVGLMAIAALMGLGIWAGMRNTLQTATGDVSGASAPAEAETPEAAVESPEAATVDSEAIANAVAEAPDEPEVELFPEDAAAAPPETAGSEPITFQINLEDDSWMQVRVDGEEVYEGTLTAGTRESWTAQSELQIIAGNSGAVLYSFNGSDETPLGAPGSVTNLTLTPDTDPQTLQPQ